MTMRAYVDGAWVQVPLSGVVTGAQLAAIIGAPWPRVMTGDDNGSCGGVLVIDKPFHVVDSQDLFDERTLESLQFSVLPKPPHHPRLQRMPHGANAMARRAAVRCRRADRVDENEADAMPMRGRHVRRQSAFAESGGAHMTDAPDILETAQKALELSAQATTGPWTAEIDSHAPGNGKTPYWNEDVGGFVPANVSDVDFIAFARNHIEVLAREVIRLRGEVVQLKSDADLTWPQEEELRARIFSKDIEIAALREVERSARDLCERLETNDRSADKIGRTWTSEGTLRKAIAALDELRGGTGE